MCLIIDFDECNETVYQSFLEKNCNRTTFEKGLELRADVEHAVTAEFELPRTKGVKTILQEQWLARYNEVIEYNKLNKDTSDSVMPEKL